MKKAAIVLIVFQLIGCTGKPDTVIIDRHQTGEEGKPIIIITGQSTGGEQPHTTIINNRCPTSTKTPEPVQTSPPAQT